MSNYQKVFRAISLYDLMYYKESKEAIINKDEEGLKKILYNLGLDIYEHYELEECTHRPLLKKDNLGWYGARYIGSERMDKAYLESGYASFEAKICATEDFGLKSELEKMSRQGSSEKAFVNESSAKKAIAKEQREIIE